ncbi:Phosphonate ABC transporter phosphate-binding periplasmic component (TC 3.A.1.9.1) [hydrothermal vent metagenome]|uniref:Phosphonate ABC transporter phosphate-binding periplasmic component (TC 3.A.1.9.1) n=1 Tax=hydrothermal vent metagenome TaxID=652676 RepID=A0A3B0YBL3_9ZZZZ
MLDSGIRVFCVYVMKKIILSFLLYITVFQPVSAKDHVYSWTVVPQFSPTIVHRDWGALLKMLEQRTGYRFRLVIADSFNFFETSLFQGKVDFAYANPYQTLLAHRAQAYIPLLRDEHRRLTGILVVRKGSPYQKVADIEGKKVAFASPNAFAVSLYMRALLSEKEKISFTPRYVGTHSNAYRQVLLGKAVASGGIYRTLRKERAEVQDNLQVIYETPKTITHAIIAHPTVPVKVRARVQQAILEMASNEKGQQLLSNVFLAQPIKADFNRDYAPLVLLNLDKYVVLPD